MIVPMKHVTLLALAATREETLGNLRDLGVLHVSVTQGTKETKGREQDAPATLAEVEQAIAILQRAKKNTRHFSSHASPPQSVEDVLVVGRALEELAAKRDQLEREERRYAPFGDFDPASARRVIASGVAVRLFKVHTKKLPKNLDESCCVLGRDGAETFGVVFDGALPEGCAEVGLPERSLGKTHAELLETREQIGALNDALADAVGRAVPARRDKIHDEREDQTTPARKGLRAPPLLEKLAAALVEARDRAAFAVAWESMGSHGAIDSIQGFMPAEDIPKLQTAAACHGWGLATRDPQPGEGVPTLLRPPKMFRPILELFKALNITPAYDESDVSIPFYIFFTLFFAMIIGDAGYGLLFLVGILAARGRMRALPRPVFVLGMVFSCATIAWGVATATYFGIPTAALPALLTHRVARWLGDQNNIMLFCFTLGATHLSLARAWNAVLLFPNRKWLAQLGWVGALWGIFFIVCPIVIQGFSRPAFTVPLLAVSVLLILFFTVGKGELKTGGVELGMLPLTLFGTMGDIISYLRLFAVGMASVQLAENFNLMAVGLPLPIYLKIPAMLIILVFAHGINLAMGAISILVHGVRLNTLEFSNAKGVSWAGSVYRPLKKTTLSSTPKPPKETP